MLSQVTFLICQMAMTFIAENKLAECVQTVLRLFVISKAIVFQLKH